MGTEIMKELESLRIITTSDFSAMACYEKGKRKYRWKYASGNVNERYKKMTGKPGQGLAGMVLRLGRLVIVDGADPNASFKRTECPLMLAENLYSAIALPIMINKEINGVLLVGRRSILQYSLSETQNVSDYAGKIAVMLNQKQNEIHSR